MTQQEERKPIPRGLIKDTQRDIIKKRIVTTESDPRLVTVDRWDLSKIFYDTRTILDKRGYDTSPMNKPEKRKAIHNDVAAICEELGVKRHEIGIFAADRAQMAFNGNIYNVTFENYKWLATLGTDLILTEKEGLVNTLLPFTTNMGIALVQSGGWSSEYAVFLIEEAHRIGFRNIAILTDFDSQGVGIVMKFPYVTRLGVDRMTVHDLDINLADVEEHIEPLKYNKKTGKMEENTHWVGLKTKQESLDPWNDWNDEYYLLLSNNLQYLRSNRVELGAITANVGALRFWNWLQSRIIEKFPKRDGNRAIDVPTEVYPDEYVDFTRKVEAKIRAVLGGVHNDWRNKLSNHEGLIKSTRLKLSEIENDMYDNYLTTSPDIKALVKDLSELMKKDYLN